MSYNRKSQGIFSNVVDVSGKQTLILQGGGESISALTASFDSRYVVTSSFSAFSSSLTGSFDQRYALTSSFNSYSASLNLFSASVRTYTASLNAFSSSVNTFSASINSFSASMKTFSAAINAFTASYNAAQSNQASAYFSTYDDRYTLTASYYPFSQSYRVYTASVNAYTASLNTYTASVNTFSASTNFYTASLNAYSASVNVFSASTNTFSASIKTYTASLNAYTASVNTFSAAINAFTATFPTRNDNRYVLTASLNGANTQLAYFTSPTSFAGDPNLIWSGGRLGVATAVLSEPLNISGGIGLAVTGALGALTTGYPRIYASSSDNNLYYQNATSIYQLTPTAGSNVAGTTNQIAYFTSNSTVGGLSNLSWTSSNTTFSMTGAINLSGNYRTTHTGTPGQPAYGYSNSGMYFDTQFNVNLCAAGNAFIQATPNGAVVITGRSTFPPLTLKNATNAGVWTCDQNGNTAQYGYVSASSGVISGRLSVGTQVTSEPINVSGGIGLALTGALGPLNASYPRIFASSSDTNLYYQNATSIYQLTPPAAGGGSFAGTATQLAYFATDTTIGSLSNLSWTSANTTLAFTGTIFSSGVYRTNYTGTPSIPAYGYSATGMYFDTVNTLNLTSNGYTFFQATPQGFATIYAKGTAPPLTLKNASNAGVWVCDQNGNTAQYGYVSASSGVITGRLSVGAQVTASSYYVYGAAGTAPLQVQFQTSDVSFVEQAFFGERAASLSRPVWAFETLATSASGTVGTTRSTAFSIYENTLTQGWNETAAGTSKFYHFAINADTGKSTSSTNWFFSVRAINQSNTSTVLGSYFAAFCYNNAGTNPAPPNPGFGYRHAWKAAYVNTDLTYTSTADQAAEESYWIDVTNRRGGWRIIPANLGIGTIPGFACQYNTNDLMAVGIGGTPSSTNSTIYAAMPMGIGTSAPKNTLDVTGNLVVGVSYGGIQAAPVNGALIQGRVGLGTTTTLDALTINGGIMMQTTASVPAATGGWGRIYVSNADNAPYYQNITSSYSLLPKTVAYIKPLSWSLFVGGTNNLMNDPYPAEMPIAFSSSVAGIGAKVYNSVITAGSVGLYVVGFDQNTNATLSTTPSVTLSGPIRSGSIQFPPGLYWAPPNGIFRLYANVAAGFAQGNNSNAGITVMVYLYT